LRPAFLNYLTKFFKSLKNQPVMRKIFAFFSIIGLLTAFSNGAVAQINTPQPSPGATLIQNVGLSEIKIEYSRPSAKGRKVMGEVVPFNGELWRVGANAATKFTTSDSLTFAGQGLAKGSYILMARPGASEWEIIFNKDLTASASDYKPAGDVVKVKVPVSTSANKTETFTINIADITNTSATLQLIWENTIVNIPFTTDIDKKVMAQIKTKLDGPTQNEYFAMSQYYLDNGKDLKEALSFVDKALAKGERFWMLRHKSLVLAKMGDKAGAISAAKRSLELAKEAKNNDYIRMNEKSIAEWTKM
jgi:hypothetical protein